MAKQQIESTVGIDDGEVVAFDEHKAARAQARTDRINAAQNEWRAVQEWRRNGEVGDKPATPTLDEHGEAFKPIRLSADGERKQRAPRDPSQGRAGRTNATPEQIVEYTSRVLDAKPNTNGFTTVLRALWADGFTAARPALKIEFDRQRAARPRVEKTKTPKTESVVEKQAPQRKPRRDASADALEARKTKSKSKTKSGPVLPVLDELISPIVKPAKSKSTPKTAAKPDEKLATVSPIKSSSKKAKSEEPKRVVQPRKGNKPVAGIKPPAKRKTS